jgi:hypothetical protein
MSDNIELEEAEPVDGSFLDVSLAEEVNSNSQENYCCGVCNKVFRRKAHLIFLMIVLLCYFFKSYISRFWA